MFNILKEVIKTLKEINILSITKMETTKVSRYCKSCQKRVTNKQRPRMDCENCIKCFKRYIEIMELNHFIDIMNEKYETNYPKYELTENRITRPKDLENIISVDVDQLNQFIIRMNNEHNTNVPTI